MKKVILSGLLSSAGLFMAFTQDVPDKVRKAFEHKFPGVAPLNWAKENHSDYGVSFVLRGRKMSAGFKEDGTQYQTGYEIDWSSAPWEVQRAISNKFKLPIVKEVDKIEKTSGEEFYEVDVKDGSKQIIVVLVDKSGNIIKNASKEI